MNESINFTGAGKEYEKDGTSNKQNGVSEIIFLCKLISVI